MVTCHVFLPFIRVFPRGVKWSNPIMFNFGVGLLWWVDNLTDFSFFVVIIYDSSYSLCKDHRYFLISMKPFIKPSKNILIRIRMECWVVRLGIHNGFTWFFGLTSTNVTEININSFDLCRVYRELTVYLLHTMSVSYLWWVVTLSLLVH